jgi:uncharacterized protein (DUF433 family)
MSVEVAYPHIEKKSGEPARLLRLPRIRISQIVMDYLAHGWSADEICRQHPHLLPAEVYAGLAYYFDHQDEIEDEIRGESEAVERIAKNLPASPFLLRMRRQGRL